MTRPPGTATDRFARASVTTIRRGDGYDIIETPSRRDFWFGNVLFLDEPPMPHEHDRWLARHAEDFAGTGVRVQLVQWETTDPNDDLSDVPPGATYRTERSVVLELGTFVTTWPRADVAVRALESDVDWEAAIALDAAGRDAAERAQDAFHRWRIGVDRESVRAGAARVLGAFEGDRLLGYAGLHANDLWMRATTPNTALAARGRGIFSCLFAELYREARARRPVARCVIVAEPGGAPERLYRSFGFRAIGVQSALVRSIAP